MVRSDQRVALERLRKIVKSAAPKAQECISDQLAAFGLGGKMLVAFGATPNHCAFYLMSAFTVEAHRGKLKSQLGTKPVDHATGHSGQDAGILKFASGLPAGESGMIAVRGRRRPETRRFGMP